MTDVLDRLATAVRLYVAEGAGLPDTNVIPGDEADMGQRPSGAYASLLFVSNRRRGYPTYRDTPGDTEITVITGECAHYSLQFYRADAFDRAYRFAAWAETLLGQEAINRHNQENTGNDSAPPFRVVFPITVGELDIEVETVIERRAVINLQVNWIHSRPETVALMDALRGTLIVDPPMTGDGEAVAINLPRED